MFSYQILHSKYMKAFTCPIYYYL